MIRKAVTVVEGEEEEDVEMEEIEEEDEDVAKEEEGVVEDLPMFCQEEEEGDLLESILLVDPLPSNLLDLAVLVEEEEEAGMEQEVIL